MPWPPAFFISRALPNWEESPRGMFSDAENWNQIHILMNLLCQAISRLHRPRARFQTQGLLRLLELTAAKPGSSGSSHGLLWTPWSGISLEWHLKSSLTHLNGTSIITHHSGHRSKDSIRLPAAQKLSGSSVARTSRLLRLKAPTLTLVAAAADAWG